MPGTVLVLAYYFPPCGAVGGLRTLKLCRYLPKAGWRPTVLAGDFPEAGAYAHDASDLALVGEVRRVRGASPRRRLLTPWWTMDTQFTWARRALPIAREMIRREKPSVILASFSPVGGLELALKLKAETGLPVVFDFRDAWTRNPALRYLGEWQRAFEEGQERRLLPGADAAMAATAPIARELSELGARRVEILPNGYDETDFAEPEPILPADAWRLSYVGNFYASMTLGPVASALAGLPGTRLRVVGGLPSAQRAAAACLGGRLEVTGPLPHPEAIREIRASHALLLLLWSGPGTDSIHSTKTFEYLRSGRPILGLVPPGEARRLLEDRGHPVLPPEASPEAIREVLAPWVTQTPATRSQDPGLGQFDRKAQAVHLAGVLDSLS